MNFYSNDKYLHLFYSTEGKFYRSVDNDPTKLIELVIDDNGYLTYRCPNTKKNFRKKAINLAYYFVYSDVKDKHVVYPKDLNPRNIELYNIGCVSREVYKQINDALKNTNGHAKIVPHKTDVYSYVLKYKKNGKTIQFVVHDIVSALKEKKKILLKSLKILNKYLISN